jgi:two-component system, sensor histidine kinase and response regulator
MKPTAAILQVRINSDEDIIRVRQRTKQLSVLAKLTVNEQTRLVTAVSEIARNALQHAGSGKARFALIAANGRQFLEVCIEDEGDGVGDLHVILGAKNQKSAAVGRGIIGAKNLVDDFAIESTSEGTKVFLRKNMPPEVALHQGDTMALWSKELSALADTSAIEELQQQNEQLVQALAEVQDSKVALFQQRLLLEERTKELERANKLKGEFLANMSHEIRTPLNAIIGTSGILAKTKLTEQQKFLVENLVDAGRSLLSLLGDILDLSKIEADKLQIDEISFDLPKHIEETMNLMSAQAFEKDIELMQFISPNLPRLVKGDSQRFRQILLNLLSNAIKFSAKGNEVVLFAWAEHAPGGRTFFRFIVLDSGIGISEADQKRLFQSFVQLDGSTGRKYGGTGLGLNICRRLVDLMDGDVGVLSEPDVGSAFWFTLPLSCEHAGELKSAYGTQDDLRKVQTALLTKKTALPHLKLMLDSIGVKNRQVSSLESLQKLESKHSSLIVIADDSAPKSKANKNARYSMVQLPSKIDEAISGRYAHMFNAVMEAAKLPYRAQRVEKEHRMPVSATKLRESTFKTNKRVLLVEDHAMNQWVTKLQLEELGLQVDVCNNGKEALRAVSGNQYGIVFMDCQMPGMDGYEATAKIRQSNDSLSKHVPIIAMTASALKGDREKCLAAGMDDYLVKPTESDLLQTVCDKWLTHSKQSKDKAVSRQVKEEQLLDVSKLAKRYDRDQQAKLLKFFKMDGETRLLDLSQCISDSRFGNKTAQYAARQVHTLKGACGLIYAHAMVNTCEAMESALHSEDLQQAKKILNNLKTEFTETIKIMEKLCLPKRLKSKGQ